jgi:quinol monooxygenase YgiN
MHNTPSRLAAPLALALFTGLAQAQGVPTTQPSLLNIVREEVKVGHGEAHAKTEAGWPAAYARAKSPNYYLALVSMTGPSEAWYVSSYASHAAFGESMKRDDADPVLSAELGRLSRADAAHLNNIRNVHAVGRPDLSSGDFPDMGLMRYFEISTWRVRPGHEQGFEAAVKAFAAASRKVDPTTSFRVYEVVAGLPNPTFFIFASVRDFAQFDAGIKSNQATMAAIPAADLAAAGKWIQEGLINNETQRFRLDPMQSYVDAATRAKDPAFWMPKKAAAR